LGGRVLFQSCDFIAEAEGTYTNPICLSLEGDDQGVLSKNTAYVLAHNCGFASLVTRNSEQGVAYDIMLGTTATRLCLHACDFDPTKVLNGGGKLLTSADFVEVV
jgi:hypothetical protein